MTRTAGSGAGRPSRVLREAWAWLTNTGYRPERHYMRGGRPAEAGR
jgi:hypothetical protein